MSKAAHGRARNARLDEKQRQVYEMVQASLSP